MRKICHSEDQIKLLLCITLVSALFGQYVLASTSTCDERLQQRQSASAPLVAPGHFTPDLQSASEGKLEFASDWGTVGPITYPSGTSLPSHIFRMTIDRGESFGSLEVSTITILMPQGLVIYKFGKEEADELIKNIVWMILELPLVHLDALKEVYVMETPSRSQDSDNKSLGEGYFMGASSGKCELYPVSHETIAKNPLLAREAFFHEFGHLLAAKLSGDVFKVPDGYLRVASEDANQVSEYGATAIWEDFAETVRLYLLSKGGAAWDPSKIIWPHNVVANPRAQFPHRFAFLDRVFTH